MNYFDIVIIIVVASRRAKTGSMFSLHVATYSRAAVFLFAAVCILQGNALFILLVRSLSICIYIYI